MAVAVAPYQMLLVDDHTIFRKGVCRLFSDEGGTYLVDEASSAREALDSIRAKHYDLVFLDLNLPGRSGLELLRMLRLEQPDMPVVILSMYKPEQYALTAIRAGARGYVSKDMECEEMLRAARTVVRGGCYIPQEVASQVLMAIANENGQPLHYSLTPREFQIVMGIVAGRSLTAIGNDLLLSVKTVSTYRARIFVKLKLRSNADLVSYAIHQGLII